MVDPMLLRRNSILLTPVSAAAVLRETEESLAVVNPECWYDASYFKVRFV